MHILLVDHEQYNRYNVKLFLTDLGHQVTEADSAGRALEEYNQRDYQLILIDVDIPDLTGLDLLDKINESKRSIPPVVLFTAHADTNCIIQAFRRGAYDFLSKPINWEELYTIIKRVVKNQKQPAKAPHDFNKSEKNLTGETMLDNAPPHIYINGIGPVFLNSPTIKQIYEIAPILHTDRSIPVLIEGETGTGKELVAQYIHYTNNGSQPSPPFVALNCSTLTNSLFESEIFGYEAGAFTGAVSSGKKGKLDLAEGGTLFLDEISEMPIKLQAKLLRVLQEKSYYRLGGLKQIENDVRIISATNKNIEELIKNNRFRSDLFYRLNTVHLKVPPLRERTADIIPLALTFLREFSTRRNKNFCHISNPAAELLRSHPWPGNIRQLRSTIDAATLFNNETVLKLKHLDAIRGDPQTRNKNPVHSHSPDSIKFDLCADRLPLETVNKKVVMRVLEMHNGNISKTARYLDISTRSLSYKLKKWDISRPSGK